MEPNSELKAMVEALVEEEDDLGDFVSDDFQGSPKGSNPNEENFNFDEEIDENIDSV